MVRKRPTKPWKDAPHGQPRGDVTPWAWLLAGKNTAQGEAGAHARARGAGAAESGPAAVPEVKREWPQDPPIPPLGTCPREIKTRPHGHLDVQVHSCVMHHSQKGEGAGRPSTETLTVGPPHDGLLPSHGKA